MLYDVNVTRISTATKTIRVEADSREEAEERAVEQSHDEEFTNCVVEYDFECGTRHGSASRTGGRTGHAEPLRAGHRVE